MKHKLGLMALLLCAALTMGGCAAASDDGALELFAVNVGKGDALLVRAGDSTCLIDAGKPWAMGRVRSAMEKLGIEGLDAVFLTHTDEDHTGGLEWLAASDIPVGAWYASGAYTGVKPEKHPMARAAQERGQTVTWLNRGDRVPLGVSGAAFTVLAPFTTFLDKDDNNSLVMLLEGDSGRMLFTGDMELPQEAALLTYGDDLACDVLKAPNHGDNDTLSAAFARAASPKLAVISTSSEEKPGTPDAGVVSRLMAAGANCVVTQEAELGLWVRLTGGAPACERVDIDAPLAGGLRILAVSAGEDTVTLINDGPDADLTGCYLHSERGDELYRFPDGYVLAAGGSVVVGTRSTKGACDLLWDDKKVIHKSKPDAITLYDAWGRALDGMASGD